MVLCEESTRRISQSQPWGFKTPRTGRNNRQSSLHRADSLPRSVATWRNYLSLFLLVVSTRKTVKENLTLLSYQMDPNMCPTHALEGCKHACPRLEKLLLIEGGFDHRDFASDSNATLPARVASLLWFVVNFWLMWVKFCILNPSFCNVHKHRVVFCAAQHHSGSGKLAWTPST